MNLKDLFESRRNPHLNPRIGAINRLSMFANRSDIYISFTQMDKLGINPNSIYSTPIGIYTYPLRAVWEHINKAGQVRGSLPFASDSPFINIVQASNAKAFVVQRYSKSDFDRDYDKLVRLYSKELSLEFMEEIKDEGIRNARFKTHPGMMWNITRLIARELSRGKSNAPVVWNKIFRDLGYAYAIDYGAGVIHTAEPHQAVFFSTKAFRMVDRIENKEVNVGGHTEDYNAPSILVDLILKKGSTVKSVFNVSVDLLKVWNTRFTWLKDTLVKDAVIRYDSTKNMLTIACSSIEIDTKETIANAIIRTSNGNIDADLIIASHLKNCTIRGNRLNIDGCEMVDCVVLSPSIKKSKLTRCRVYICGEHELLSNVEARHCNIQSTNGSMFQGSFNQGTISGMQWHSSSNWLGGSWIENDIFFNGKIVNRNDPSLNPVEHRREYPELYR